jgi:hypothetical protein
MPYCLRMAAVSIIACGFGRAAAGDVEAVAPGASGVLTKCRGWLVVTSCKTYQHISLPPRIAVRDTITLRFGRPQGLCVSGRADRPEGQHCVIFSEAEGNRQPNGQDRCRSVPSDGRGAPTPRASAIPPDGWQKGPVRLLRMERSLSTKEQAASIGVPTARPAAKIWRRTARVFRC